MNLADYDAATGESNCCPVSGLPIFQKPEWKDVQFNSQSNYKISVQMLGEKVLLIKSFGFGRLEDLKSAVDFTHQIVNENFPQDSKYVRIEDLSQFKGISNDARAFYSSSMARTEPLLGVIYFNVSPLLKWSVQLGIKFGMVPFSVQLASSYEDAVRRAQKLF